MKKRRALAIMMACTMTLGFSTTAFAEEHTDHGTENGAAIATGSTEMTTDKTSGNTDFYIKIDKDATDGEVPVEEGEDVTPTDPDGNESEYICHYIVQWEGSQKSNLKVTVPLYVCMYGYGGDGKVVTPAEDAYKMTNESTYSYNKTLTQMAPCYKVTVITRENAEQIEEEWVVSLTEEQKSGQYGVYKEDAAAAAEVVRLSDCRRHAADSGCDHVISGVAEAEWEYFYVGEWITEGSIQNTDKEGYEDGVTLGEEITKIDTGLPVRIPTIKAENNTWSLKHMNEATSLKAGEIAMSINGLELIDVLGEDHDITGFDWKIGCTKDDNVFSNNTLNLPVKAVIAGNNVNEEGCVPVIRVTYTISPDRR